LWASARLSIANNCQGQCENAATSIGAGKSETPHDVKWAGQETGSF
jgi:hypothetical protein